MPEIVPADKWEILLLEERLEIAIDYVLGVLRGALGVAKTSPESS